MRNIITSLLFLLASAGAFAQTPVYIDSPIEGDMLVLNQDTVISKHAFVLVEELRIAETLFLENSGTISSQISVCDACTIFVRNNGIISGEIAIGNNSKLIQVVHSDKGLTRLNTDDGNFSVWVRGRNTLNLSDIISFASGATKLTLDNVSVLLGHDAPRDNTELEIELVGEIVIKVPDYKKLQDSVLLHNVYGDGVVNIQTTGSNKLYTARAIRADNNVYLQINRETDYQKILGASAGKRINALREIAPYNGTVTALDNADSITEINSIVGNSIVLNPINLIRPIKIFNSFEMNRFGAPSDSDVIDIVPVYITSDDTNMYAARAVISMPFDSLNLSASLYAGMLENDDDANNYSGTFYGGNINVYYKYKSLWIDATVGLTGTSFESDLLFNGNKFVSNATGNSIYTVTDIGTKFDFYNEFYLSPFLGVGAEIDTVFEQEAKSVFGRTGGIIGFGNDAIGIKYDYQIFAIAQTNNIQSAGVKMNVWSVVDRAGGNISYAFNHDEVGFSHQVSIGMKFAI